MSELFINGYAIDLSKNSLTDSDVYDAKALIQSVENILLTIPGERVFEPGFGSPLMATVFKNLNTESGEKLLDSLISSINRFEPRVRVLPKQCGLEINQAQNKLTISIVFIALKTGNVITYRKTV